MDSVAGHLADPIPDTGYEPKFCIDVSIEHTPINLSDQKHEFTARVRRNDHRFRGPQCTPTSGASSSSQHTAASRASGDLCGHESLNSCFKSFRVCVKEEERSRPKRCANIERQAKYHKILERKAELAVRGEQLAKQRLYVAEADVEVKHWEKRNSDTALYEIDQEFESQRLQLQQANQWADEAQRDKTRWYGELEMRNGDFREYKAKGCQDIEEFRRICCEETDRARQARIDELSMQQERNSTTVSQLMTQIRELQNKVNFLSETKGSCDPGSGSGSGATHVPSQPSSIPSLRTMPFRDSGLPRDARVLQETFLNDFLLEKDGTSTLFNNSKNLASTSQKIET